VIDFTAFPFWVLIAAFLAAAAAIAVAGSRLAGVADEFADRTGMGEVLAGAIFVGASTSLPGIITSVSTAAQGHPGIAIGNALGGITIQTAFLAVADIAYRRGNLEHGAASLLALAQGTLLVTLLTLPVIAMALPEMTLFGIHPLTPLLPLAYGLGLRLLAMIKREPLWNPVMTAATQDEAKEAAESAGKDKRSNRRLWVTFAVLAAVTAAAGFVIGEASVGLVRRTGLSESAVGSLFSAVSTSLPELVTAVAAVRRGALGLAVGDIIGGNCFDMLFLAGSDIAYRTGSLYHRFSDENVFTVQLAILMTGMLLLGLLRRQPQGFAGIGFESVTILGLYGLSVLVLMV